MLYRLRCSAEMLCGKGRGGPRRVERADAAAARVSRALRLRIAVVRARCIGPIARWLIQAHTMGCARTAYTSIHVARVDRVGGRRHACVCVCVCVCVRAVYVECL